MTILLNKINVLYILLSVLDDKFLQYSRNFILLDESGTVLVNSGDHLPEDVSASIVRSLMTVERELQDNLLHVRCNKLSFQESRLHTRL